MNARKYLLLLLVVFTLVVVAYDYTAGHTASDIVTVSRCPLCAAFMTTIAGVSFISLLVFLGLIPPICFLRLSDVFSLAAFLLSGEIPGRAPPVCA